MEIIRKLDKSKSDEIMKERGYIFTAYWGKDSENPQVLNYSKKTDLGVNISALVDLKRYDITLQMVELKMCYLGCIRVDFFHKNFEKFEKILYVYTKACLNADLSFIDNVNITQVLQYNQPEISKNTKESIKPKIQKNIEEKKKDLWNKVRQIGKEKKYSKEICMSFYNYWTEMNDGGKKMRFELEKIFDVSRRLVTWISNEKKWDKTGFKTPIIEREIKAITKEDAF